MDYLIAQQTASIVTDAFKLASRWLDQKYAQELAHMQMAFATTVIQAVVSRKLDVIEKHYAVTLKAFDKQNDTFLEERAMLSRARAESNSRIKRSDIAAQIADVDSHLRDIRAHMLLLAEKLDMSLANVGFRDVNFRSSVPALVLPPI